MKDQIIPILVIVLFVIFLLSVLFLDGFLRYPIPGAESLSGLDFAYSDWNLLNEERVRPDHPLLLEKDGQLRVILLRQHLYTGRYMLLDDVPVDPQSTETYSLGNIFSSFLVKLQDGPKLEMRGGQYVNTRTLGLLAYGLIALVPTVAVCLIGRAINRKRTAA